MNALRLDLTFRKRNILIFAALSVFVLMLIPVFAGPVTFLQQLAKGWLEDICMGTLNENVLTVFSSAPASQANLSAGWAVASSVNTSVVQPVGYSLVGLCFTIKVAKIATDYEHITPERFFTPFAQLAGCLFLVGHSYEIMTTCINIGTALAVSVQNRAMGLLGTDIKSLTSQMMPQFDESHGVILGYLGELWESAMLVAQLLIPHLAYRIASFTMKIIAYGVIIEIVVRASIFPLFGGDIMLHGFEGHGMRYLKGFMACCAQGAIIVLIAAIQNALNVASLQQVMAESGGALQEVSTIVKATGKIVVFDFAGIALMLKASQITREALGA